MQRKRAKKKSIGRTLLITGAAVGGTLLALSLSYVGLNLYTPAAVAYSGEKNPNIMEKGKTLVSAHRSGGGVFPENTMMALKGCVESQDFVTDVFEFDLHRTKDGRLILLHDESFDRTTNAVELFGKEGVTPSEKTFDELYALNFGESFTDPEGKQPYKGLRGAEIPEDLHVLSLEQALDYLESQQAYRYIIEIKDGGEDGFRGVDELCRIVKERSLLDRVIFGTFQEEVSRYVDESHPELMRSAGIKEVLYFYLSCLVNRDLGDKELPYVALQVPANQYFPIRLGTEKFINYAHRYNLAVQYWTINEEEEIRRLSELGADTIMSDYPDKAYRVIHGE